MIISEVFREEIRKKLRFENVDIAVYEVKKIKDRENNWRKLGRNKSTSSRSRVQWELYKDDRFWLKNQIVNWLLLRK